MRLPRLAGVAVLVLVPSALAQAPAKPSGEIYTGYIDRTGKVVIEPRFTGPGQRSFTAGLAKVESANRKAGFIDKTGRFVIEPALAFAQPFSEGLAVASSGGAEYGFIDRTGQWAIAPAFVSADSFSEGVAHVVLKRGDKVVNAYVARTGAVVLEVKADRARGFSGGLAAVQVGGRWGFMDRRARMVVPPRFALVYDVTEGMAAVQHAFGQMAFVDAASGHMIESTYEFAYHYAGGVAAVLRDGQWSYVDKAGRDAFAGRFEKALPFTEGLAAVRLGGKFGYIDRAGTMVIAPRFDDGREFGEGLAPVKVGDRYGFIDKTGAFVIEPRFDGVDPFSEGMAMVYVVK